MTRVLVTGGAGFIGSHLVEHLASHGNEVLVLDDLSTGHADYLPSRANIKLLVGNVLDAARFADDVGPVETIFHLAALISGQDSLRSPEEYLATNVTGTLRVIQLVKKLGARRIVFASSSTVYGDGPGTSKHEGLVPKPITVYALTKLTAEHLLALYAPIFGYSHVSLRLFNVYGPRQKPDHPYANVTCKLAHAVSHSRVADVYGDGEQTRDFVYVEDVVRAFLAVADHSEQPVYNVGSGRDTSVNDLIASIERLSNVRLQRREHPPWPNDIRSIRAQIDRLAQEFGYAPRFTLDDGLARTISYFRELSP